jgi:hypothetical protein
MDKIKENMREVLIKKLEKAELEINEIKKHSCIDRLL